MPDMSGYLDTPAERAFAGLTDAQRVALLRRVFDILGYDKDAVPGRELDSDVLGELCGAFTAAGVVFISPDEVQRCDECGGCRYPVEVHEDHCSLANVVGDVQR